MEILLTAAFALLGAVLASFIAVVAERAYTGQSWAQGRSRCDSCRTVLAFRDLVPVLSWCLNRGRCQHCGSRLTFGYVLGELALGLLFALGYHALGVSLALLPFLVALCVLFFITLYDLRHTVVPPVSSLLLLFATFAFAVLAHEDQASLGLSLLVAGAISLFIFLLHACSRGRAMGLGDAPVAFALALLVGSTHAFPGLVFSFWIGALFGVGLLLGRRGRPTMGREVPFVPFLAAGFLLAYFTQWNPFPLSGL